MYIKEFFICLFSEIGTVSLLAFSPSFWATCSFCCPKNCVMFVDCGAAELLPQPLFFFFFSGSCNDFEIRFSLHCHSSTCIQMSLAYWQFSFKGIKARGNKNAHFAHFFACILLGQLLREALCMCYRKGDDCEKKSCHVCSPVCCCALDFLCFLKFRDGRNVLLSFTVFVFSFNVAKHVVLVTSRRLCSLAIYLRRFVHFSLAVSNVQKVVYLRRHVNQGTSFSLCRLDPDLFLLQVGKALAIIWCSF